MSFPVRTQGNLTQQELCAGIDRRRLINGMGAIRFEPCRLWFVSPALGWLHLQELAKRRGGHQRVFTLAALNAVSAEEATIAYRRMLHSILGQFAVMPEICRQQLFVSLLQSVEHSGSFEGLAGPFLTGLNAMEQSGQGRLVEAGLAAWDYFGSGDFGSAGTGATPFLDVGTGAVSFLGGDALTSLGPQGSNRGVLSSGFSTGSSRGPGFGLGIQSLAEDGDDGGGSGGSDGGSGSGGSDGGSSGGGSDGGGFGGGGGSDGGGSSGGSDGGGCSMTYLDQECLEIYT